MVSGKHKQSRTRRRCHVKDFSWYNSTSRLQRRKRSLSPSHFGTNFTDACVHSWFANLCLQLGEDCGALLQLGEPDLWRSAETSSTAARATVPSSYPRELTTRHGSRNTSKLPRGRLKSLHLVSRGLGLENADPKASGQPRLPINHSLGDVQRNHGKLCTDSGTRRTQQQQSSVTIGTWLNRSVLRTDRPLPQLQHDQTTPLPPSPPLPPPLLPPPQSHPTSTST